MKHTWVVDVCEENVRITHFRNYNTWMSERMKLWWRERKAKETEPTVFDVDADKEVSRRLSIMRQIGHMWPIIDPNSNEGR